jgi:hypothetical protein
MHVTPLVALLGSLSLVTAQQSHPLFDAPVIAVDGWSRIDELVDLDLDGDLDGFGLFLNQVSQSGQPAFMQAKLHRNDGSGQFTSSVIYQWSSSPGQPTQYRSAVGDIDGDGHNDVITLRGAEAWIVESRSGQPTARVLTQGPPLGISAFAYVTGAQLSDVDGDARAELITADTTDGLRVWRLNPTTFQRRCIAVPSVSATELVTVEANGDTVPDVAVVDGGTVRLFPTNQLGGIAPFASFVLPPFVSDWGSPGKIAAGDVDNDGDVDLIVFGNSNNLYCKLERTGPAQWVVGPAVAGGPAAYLHDFDGDGDLDGTCCGGGGGPQTTSPNTALGNFQVAENLGGGVFAPVWRLPIIGPFHLAGCADMDGDGRNDLVGGRCIYFGRGRHDPAGTVLPAAATTRVVDVDSDGDPDVLDATGSQWTNRGNGKLAAAPIALPSAPPGGTWSVLPGSLDFDQDGDADVLANAVMIGNPVATHLLRNQGGGLFVDAGALTPNGTTLANTEPLSAADVDGDGDLDVLAGDSSPAWQLWLQTGGALVLANTWAGMRIVGVAELTGDARADVLVATYPFGPSNTGWMDLSVQSLGQSGTWVVHPVGQFPSLDAVGIVDHEGDGDGDLVLFDTTGPDWVVRVWTNDGTASFLPQQIVATVVLAQRARIATADLDGDGRYDIVAGPAGYHDALPNSGAGVHVLRQTAPQQFTAVLHSSHFGWPTDADGDGDVDLVGRAMLRNTQFDGPSAGEREQVGVGLAGTGGGKPVLGATGPFRVGGTLTTTLTGGCGQGVAVFVASFFRADPPQVLVPGFLFYLDSPLILGAIALDGGNQTAGDGSASFTLPILPFVAGVDFYQQAIVADAAGVGPGVTHTQALRVRFGW